jgi:hypothetical protein
LASIARASIIVLALRSFVVSVRAMPVNAVIAAHGGLERWSAVRSIDVTFNFSGALLELKGTLRFGVMESS